MDLILEPALLTAIHTTTRNNPGEAGRKKILEQMRTLALEVFIKEAKNLDGVHEQPGRPCCPVPRECWNIIWDTPKESRGHKHKGYRN